MMIGILQEPGIYLHLAYEYGLERRGHSVPRRNFFVPRCQFAIFRNDSQLFLARESFLAQLVPTLIELAFVLIRPFFGNVVRCVGGTRREIHEEGLIGNQRLLLTDPVDSLVRHILHEVIAFFGSLLHLDRCGAFVERGIPLVRLSADEPVEIFKAPATGGPCVEGPRGTRFPDGDFMTLAELRRGVAVELERARERRA